jgi:hypothetical protein
MVMNPLPPGETSRRARDWYEEHIRRSVECEHFAKYLVLDIDTGDYEIDADHLTASNRAAARRPDARLFTIRIGYDVGGRIGSRTQAVQP